MHTLGIDATKMSPTALICRWAGAMGIAVIAVLRMLVVFSGDPYFDVDPVAFPVPMAGLGPVGGLWLDAALLLAAALALVGEALARRPVRWWMMLPALVPGLAVVLHGTVSFEDAWRGWMWTAGMAAFVAAAHLARDISLRAVLLGAMVGAAVPLLTRGALQVTTEHAEMVREFERQREMFFAARGWAVDSTNAQMYERRLMQPEASGWFGLANVYGSVMAVMMVIGVGGAWMTFREKMPGGWRAVMLLVALGGAAGLMMSGSKGALGAAGLGIAVLVAGWSMRPSRRGVMLMALPLMVLLGVAARGVLLPERFAGDLSLFFRWQYIEASGRMMAEQPLLGVGPGSFQEAYVRLKSARSPEDVMSAHSVFIDWGAMLGVFGVLWAGLLLSVWGRTAFGSMKNVSRIDDEADEWEQGDGRLPRGLVIALGVIFAGAGVAAMLIELHAVSEIGLLARALGVMGAILAGGVVAGVVMRAPAMSACVASAGACALLIHAQIEMTFFQPGSVVWACVVMACAAGPFMVGEAEAPASKGASTRYLDIGSVGLAGIMALVLGWFTLRPALLSDALIRDAAATLAEVGMLRQEGRVSDAELHAREIEARRIAIDRLEEACARNPAHRALWATWIGQQALLAARQQGEARLATFNEAFGRALERVAHDPSARMLALAASLAEHLALLEDKETWLPRAIDLRVMLIRRDPHGLESYRALAEAQWSLGRYADAAASYRRVIEISDNYELDALRQLDAASRAAIEERLREAERMP